MKQQKQFLKLIMLRISPVRICKSVHKINFVPNIRILCFPLKNNITNKAEVVKYKLYKDNCHYYNYDYHKKG